MYRVNCTLCHLSRIPQIRLNTFKCVEPAGGRIQRTIPTFLSFSSLFSFFPVDVDNAFSAQKTVNTHRRKVKVGGKTLGESRKLSRVMRGITSVK